MRDYLWSARFICGVLTLLLGVSLLVGALLFVPDGGLDGGGEARYYAAVGAGLCAIGPVLALHSRAGLVAYGVGLAAAVACSLVQAGLDLWVLLPRLAALLLWGGILFALRHRIAPTHAVPGPLHARRRRAWRSARRPIEEHF